MTRESRFWDWIAERYARQPVADEESYQKKLQATRDHLRPDMELLEFGCGTGSTALTHAPYVNHIEAIDIAEKMLAIAKRKADAAHVGNITFQQTSIDDYTPDRPFDVVLGMSILHLVKDRDATITKVYAMLKPGGLFVSSTSCLGDTMSLFRIIGPIGHFIGILPLLKIFTVDDLQSSLTKAGFTIDQQWQPGAGKAVFIVARKPAE